MDLERLERARRAMTEAGIDVLVCRLAENVLYLSDYWPITGANAVILPKDDEPVLILEEEELDFVGPECIKDIRTFRFTNLSLSPGLNHKMAPVLAQVFQDKGLGKATVGYEGSFETMGCVNTAIAARPVPESAINMLKDTLPGATLVDATEAIMKARRVKSKLEIEKHRLANEVACFGLEAAKEAIKPGVTEAEVAAAVEAAIHSRGVGYKGVQRARGFAFIMSGVNSATSWRPFCISTDKRIKEGEPVLVELDAYADGFLNDLTRTFIAGEPSARDREIEAAVMASLKAVEARLRPGMKTKDLDVLSHQVIAEHGFGEYYPHQLGHGIGYQFHEPPIFHPQREDVLEVGNVFALEPAIYIPGYGGVREEDNYVITEDGFENITPYPQGLGTAK